MDDTDTVDGAIGGDYHEGLHCCGCCRPLTKHSVFFDLIAGSLEGCHVICPLCYCNSHAARGSSRLHCPAKSCNNIIIGHRSVQWGNEGRETSVDPPFMFQQPNPDLDAHRLFSYEPRSIQDNNIVLSASFIATGNGGKRQLKSISAIVPTDTHCDEYDEILQKKLLAIARLLYHVFVYPPSQFNDMCQQISVDTITKFERFALSDYSFLVNVFVALFTGKSLHHMLPKGELSNPYQRSNYLAIYVGIELMRRSTSMTPGILQNVIQKHLSVHNVPVAVKASLCRLRICSSREKVRLEDIQEVKKQLVKGWDLAGKQYWMIFVMYDNLGFRIKGARAGYDQYINIIVHFVSPNELRRLGFYLPPGAPERPISRTRCEWEDLREELCASSILPTSPTYACLGVQVYSLIDALLQICNRIPSLEQAIALLSTDGTFEVDDRLPTTYGAQRRVEIAATNTGSVEVEQEETFAEDEVDDQHIEYDVPMHADLAKKNSVKNLCIGTLELRDNILASSAAPTDPVTDEAPIMVDHGVHQGADGSPKHSFHTLRDDSDRDYINTYVHGGGFHKHLAVLNGLGKKFADSHLWYFLHGHRNTDPKKEFFLFPSDPGQTLHELPEMTAPHYVAAIRNVASLKGNAITAVDVHDFMLQRALEHDHCMVVLMWLHFVEISNLIRDSESENDPELYRAGATLSMLLFAKTNSTKYVRMGIEDFIWWQTSSEADRKLYNAFYFTKKTTSGKHIFFDRFVEWVNKDVRFYLGKYAKPNQERLMQRTMLLLKRNKSMRRDDAVQSNLQQQNHHARPAAGGNEEIATSPIFCQQLALVYKHNYWGQGPVLVGKNEDMRPPRTFTDPSGEHNLNRNLLFDISAAEEALQIVFQECKLSDDPKRHTEMDSFLRSTPVLLKEVSEERKQELIRLTSTDKGRLKAASTASFLQNRITQLRDAHPFLQEKATFKSRHTKEALAEILADYHKELHRHDPSFLETTKRRLQSWYDKCDGFAPMDQKKRELDKPFYRFSNDAKHPFLEKAYVIDPHQPEQQAPASPRHAMNANDTVVTPVVRRMNRLSLD